MLEAFGSPVCERGTYDLGVKSMVHSTIRVQEFVSLASHDLPHGN
jgi:hypothetical protein